MLFCYKLLIRFSVPLEYHKMFPFNTKTPAMSLQEYTVKKKISAPEYNLVVSKCGTHENEFHYKVNVAGISALGIGR